MQVQGEAINAIGRVVDLYRAGEIPCCRCGGHPDGFYSVIVGHGLEVTDPKDCARFRLMAFCRTCLTSGELHKFVEGIIVADEAANNGEMKS